jgi:Lar family restriction alleviation protein
MSTTKQLQPCPFCGEKEDGEIDTNTNPSGTCHYVWCWNCEAQGPPRRTEGEAIEEWNKRYVERGAQS